MGWEINADYRRAVDAFQWPAADTMPTLAIFSSELEDVTRQVFDQINRAMLLNATHSVHVRDASYMDTAYYLMQYQDKHQHGDTATVGRIEHATVEEKFLLSLVHEQLSQGYSIKKIDRIELKRLTLLCGIHRVHDFIHTRSQGLFSRLYQLGSSYVKGLWHAHNIPAE